jgi:hypothetical protein
MKFKLFLLNVILINLNFLNITPASEFSKDSLLFPKSDLKYYPFSLTYNSPWSNLKNGKEQNLNKSSDIKWNSAPIIIDDKLSDCTITEEGKKNTSIIVIKGNNKNSDVEINNNGRQIIKHFNNKRYVWNKNDKNIKGYYSNNIIYLKKFDKVIIENINLQIWDPALNEEAKVNGELAITGSTTVRLEDCNNVEIRDCYFGGEARRHHIQIENSNRVFIDRVEFAGIKLKDKNQYLCGGGIKISKNNFEKENEKQVDIWNVIQNCYMHDNNARFIEKFNWDGITTSTPGNSLIFNCYFENWGIGSDETDGKIGADCAVDLSEPEVPVSYKDYVLRVERNIFEKCKGVKNSYTYLNNNGCSNFTKRDTTINNIKVPIYNLVSVKDFDCISHLFVNNVYYNTPCWDYHHGYNVYHMKEIFVFDDDCYKRYAYKFEGSDLSPVIFKNNILYENRKTPDFHIFNIRNFNSDKGSKKDFAAMKLIDNIYVFNNQPAVWVNFINNKQDNIKSLMDWKKIEIFGDEKNNKAKGSRIVNNSQPENLFRKLNIGAVNKGEFYKSDFHLSQEYIMILSNISSQSVNPLKKGMIIKGDYYKEK